MLMKSSNQAPPTPHNADSKFVRKVPLWNQKLPSTKAPYPNWDPPIHQPPHVKINPVVKKKRPLPKAKKPSAYAKVEQEHNDKKGIVDLPHCSFGICCTTGFSEQTKKTAVATIRDYTDAKFDPKGLGFYCDECFKVRHPWYRIPTYWVKLVDFHDPVMDWNIHEKSAQFERVVLDFTTLLRVTTDFKENVCAAMNIDEADKKIVQALKDVEQIDVEIREIMDDFRSGTYGGGGTRKERIAASKLQGLWRVRSARKRLRKMLRTIYQRFQDPATGAYYYYNTRTQQTVWFKPAVLGDEDVDVDPDEEREKEAKRQWRRRHPMTEEEGAKLIQGLFRSRLARRRLHQMLMSVYQKVFDPTTGRYYYFNKQTGKVTWNTPQGLTEDELLTPRSFAMKEKRQAMATGQVG
jgi:hypothetical protein